MKKLGLVGVLLGLSTSVFARPEWVEVLDAYKQLDKNNQYVLTYVSETSGDVICPRIDGHPLT
jgi:hypothetical protein